MTTNDIFGFLFLTVVCGVPFAFAACLIGNAVKDVWETEHRSRRQNLFTAGLAVCRSGRVIRTVTFHAADYKQAGKIAEKAADEWMGHVKWVRRVR